MTILLASVAAIMLVPAAQSFAGGTTTAHLTGSGSGEVIDGARPEVTEAGKGTPALACTYASPGPATGVCTDEPESGEGSVISGMRALAAPGSEFTGWTVQK